jgi:Cu2+-exporting ATPase
VTTAFAEPAAACCREESPAAALCFHCGLPLDAGGAERVRLGEEVVAVCCPGCAAAVDLVSDAGLEDYYRLREARTGIRARDATCPADGARADWTAPAVTERFVQHERDGDRAELAVDGMRCAACSWLLENGLLELAGVREVNVELTAGRADVRWDPATADLAGVMAQVRRLGFECAPAHAGEEEALLEAQRRRSLRALGISGVVAMQVMMLAVADYAGDLGAGIEAGYRGLLLWAEMVLATVAVCYGAGVFFHGALRALNARRLTMDVPVALAIGLAWGASVILLFSGAAEAGAHLYFDSVCMFVFLLLLGRHLELGIRHRFAHSDARLGALLPAVAQRVDDDPTETAAVPAQGLLPGDRIRVRAGETVAADGRVIAGSGGVDRSALSGESAPVAVASGDVVEAGSRSVDGVLDLVVLRPPQASAVAGIPALLDRARRQRPRAARLADLVASRFLAGVLVAAALAGAVWLELDPSRALEVVLATLIVTCPCALSLATPSAITAASVRLRRSGVLVADPDTFETLAQCREICFDKTGTLTTPLTVDARRIHGAPSADRVVAALERDVDHPLARALAALDPHAPQARDVRVTAGAGVSGEVDGVRYRLGRAAFCGGAASGDGIHLAREGETTPLARYEIVERLRPGIDIVLEELRSLGLVPLVLSGDSAARTAAIAEALDIETWRGDAAPEDKLAWLQDRMTAGRHVVYVGDGINDAPVLGGASASVAVGTASDYARTAADAVLLDEGLDALPALVRVARRARRRIRLNLAWALGYNLLAVPLALTGMVTPWMAALGMSASSLVVILGSAALLREEDA